MHTVFAAIDKAEEKLASLLFILVVGLVLLGAISRVVNHPLVWAPEIAQILFIWTCMLGADILLKRKGHIGVDLFTRYLPSGLRSGIEFLMFLILTAFCAYVAWYGMVAVLKNGGRTFGSLDVSYAWATAGVFAGALLMTISGLRVLARDLAALRGRA